MLIDGFLKNFKVKNPELVGFSVVLPDGKTKKFGSGKEKFVVRINTNGVLAAILAKGSLGLGEQYMLGNVEIEGDLATALETLINVFYRKEANHGSPVFRAINFFRAKMFTQTPEKSLHDVQAHYDLSNEFYRHFLDKSMTYSCAYFKNTNDSLEVAQEQKYEHICRKLMLKKGETLIDVGCGWGGMLIYSAKRYGVSGVGITLSKNQFEYTRDLIKKENLDNVLRVELKDYRELTGQFDKFVSIGMFEHVTEAYYGEYFGMVKRVLKPMGIGVLHTIGISQNREKGYAIDPWYETYIFPGTYLPTLAEISKYLSKFELYPQDVENLRLHYALTLGWWIKKYERVYQKTVSERGIKFARMWMWYLCLSRATFLCGISQLWQTTFVNGVDNDYPLERKRLYD